MDLNIKEKRYSFLPFIALILITAGLIGRKIGPKKVLKWDFKGPVEKVWYGDKGYPYVIVNGKEYDLYYTIWHFQVKIQKGDTIIKKKSDRRIKILRPNSKDTIYFNSFER